MIFDEKKNLNFYRNLGIEGRYAKAVDFLVNTDLAALVVDWRRRTAVAQADKSARACHFHYAGYHHHEHFAGPVSVGAKYHTVFSTVS